MRWKGLIFIVVLSALIVALFFLFSDEWVENKIENTATDINGAKVEIDGFDLSLFQMSAKWSRLQVTNPEQPMKNSLESGKAHFSLEFMPLIRGKVVIDTIEFADVRTNTERKTSGALPKKEKKEKSEKTGEKRPEEPGFADKATEKLKSKAADYKDIRLESMKSDLNVDSIMLAVDLSSIDYINEAQADLDQKLKKWEKTLTSDEFNEDYEKLKQQYEEIAKINPNKIKSIKELKSVIEKLERAKKDLESVNNKVKKYKKDFEQDFEAVKLTGKEIETRVKKDYKEIEKMAKIPDIDTQNIADFIFGETLVQRIHDFFSFLDKIEYYKDKLASGKEEEKKPERHKGQDIEFSGKYDYPGFWIKNLIFSGTYDKNIAVQGKITDILSDQKKVNKTTQAKITGTHPNQSNVAISATIDTRSRKNFDMYSLDYSNVPIQNYTVSKSSIFPYDVAEGMGKINGHIKINRGKYIGFLNFFGTDMEFRKNAKTSEKSEIQKFIDQSVKNLSSLNVKCRISNDNISINSNIDDIFNKEIKNYLNKNITEAKNKVRKEIDAKVNRAKNKYEKQKQAAKAEIDKKLNTYNDKIEQYRKDFEAKKSEAEKEIKEKGTDALKNLF